MKKILIGCISSLFIIFSFFYMYRELFTISNDIDKLDRFIKVKYSNIKMVKTKDDDKNIFLVYKESTSDRIFMFYFEKHKYFKDRCVYRGESSTKLNYNLSIRKEHNNNLTQTLWILYGKNINLNYKNLYLNFNDCSIKEDISNERYFIFIYRFMNEEYIPDIVLD